MTTIAYDGESLAADSQETSETEAGGATKHVCAKLFRKRVGEGRKAYDVIIATAGETFPGMVFVDWYGSGKDIPRVLIDHDPDFTVLILTPHGLLEADKYCRPIERTEKFYAIGSGRKEALAAMACGKSAADAVRIAARFDNYTGGRVITMKLDDNGKGK